MKIGTNGFVMKNTNEQTTLWNGEITTFDFIFSLNQDFDGIIFYVMINEIALN